jgi:hypothetical protein
MKLMWLSKEFPEAVLHRDHHLPVPDKPTTAVFTV